MFGGEKILTPDIDISNPHVTFWRRSDLYSYATLRYLSVRAYRPVYLVNVRFTLKHPPSTHRQQTTTATSSTDNLLRLIYVLLCSTLNSQLLTLNS